MSTLNALRHGIRQFHYSMRKYHFNNIVERQKIEERLTRYCVITCSAGTLIGSCIGLGFGTMMVIDEIKSINRQPLKQIDYNDKLVKILVTNIPVIAGATALGLLIGLTTPILMPFGIIMLPLYGYYKK